VGGLLATGSTEFIGTIAFPGTVSGCDPAGFADKSGIGFEALGNFANTRLQFGQERNSLFRCPS
jgi:hypothetical protein